MAATTQLAPGARPGALARTRAGGPVSAARSAPNSPRSVRSAPPTGRCSPWSSSPSGSARSPAWARYPAEADHGPNFDPTFRSLVGLYLGQLIIAVLGALTITSEYATGMIRTSLTVQPRRGTLFAAKAVVFAVVSLVTGLVASFASFFIGQAILSGQHLNTTLSQPHVLRAVIGGGLFLAACGLLSFGLGAILRHTAAAITAAIGLLFVLTILTNFLPQSWQVHVDKWIPANAGSQIWTVVTDPSAHLFSAWTGFGVFAAYAAIAIGAGFILFRKRDA